MNPSTTLDFQQAKAKHLLFKSRLRAILYDEGNAADSRVLSQYACEVGKWLYSHALIHYEDIPEVYALEYVHSQLHRIARDLIDRYQQGNITEARQGLSEMERLADQLVNLLQLVESKVSAINLPDQPNKATEPADKTQALQALLAQNELLDNKIKQRTQKTTHKNQGLYNFFMQAPAAFCILRGPEHVYELANPDYQQLIGGRNPLGKPIRQALPELEGQGFYELLDSVYTTQEAFTGKSIPVTLLNATGQGQVVYLDFIYQPTVDVKGQTDGILVFAYNVTEQVLANRKLEESEQFARSLFENSPVANLVFTGEDMRIRTINENMLAMLGRDATVIGLPFMEAMPELVQTPLMNRLRQVLATGETFYQSEEKIDLIRHGQPYTGYYNYIYKALYNTDNERYGVIVTATEVTEQVLARKKVEDSELYARNIVDSTDAAIIVYEGPDMICKLVNERMLEIFGRDEAAMVGKPLLEAAPELVGSALPERFRRVMQTGESFFQPEELFTLIRHGKPYTGYYTYTYKAQKNEAGIPYRVLCTTIEITDQVLTRKKIEQAEASLRSAVELAELGTWQIDLTTGILDYSERLRTWCGMETDEVITIDRAYCAIQEADRPRVKAAITHAITPGTDGVYLIEYTLDAAQAGQERILKVQGKAFFNEQGQAYMVTGMAQDVTEQRNSQLALEQRVQERTEQLAAINEELTAASEAITEANRGLEEANLYLSRSNQNLEQFAYIASHDLQEPLRKIQQFGDLLKTRYANPEGEELIYLERMQSAASRMSLLIKDLLAFSRISTRQAATDSVSLDQVVTEALDNLSVAISETKAHIQVGALPVIQGDTSQLGQLFLNLLSNAIKFSRKDQSDHPLPPHIIIRTDQLLATDLPPSLKPTRQAAAYHRIDVVDNGVGFDEKYLDRIFQVFQRLHGKNEFAGTGVGLAICQKVVTNHGGAITAVSKPGEGTIFSVYLPV